MENAVRADAPRRVKLSRKAYGRLVLYAVNVVLACLFLAPWIWAIAITILPQNLLYRVPPVLFHWPPILDSYKSAIDFDHGRLLQNMGLSAVIAIATSVCVVMVSGLAGYAFARLKFLGKDFFFIAVLATMMFPFTAILMPLFSMMHAMNLVNNPISLVILYTTFELPFSVFMFRNSFAAIPSALRDAATIDGCHEFGVLRRIMLPLSKPAIATVLICSLYHCWNEFTAALIFLTSDKTTVPVLLSYMANSGRFGSKYNILLAASVLSFLPILALFAFFQRFFVPGLMSGSVKG